MTQDVRSIGLEISPETIPKITGKIADEVRARQHRPLAAFYPIIYLDAIRVKISEGGYVRDKPAHLGFGLDMNGMKHILGVWVQTSPGAKFWAGVGAELAGRGLRDVLVLACEDLAGLPEAFQAIWPGTIAQTAAAHLMRAANQLVPASERRAVGAALRPLYQAVDVAGAQAALEVFAGSGLGRRHPGAVKVFRDAWEQFVPFLSFPPELRHVIATTDTIELLTRHLRHVAKNRGPLPSDDAAVKLLWLAICCLGYKRDRDRAGPTDLAGSTPATRPGQPPDASIRSGTTAEGSLGQAGYLEIGPVAHCGHTAEGDYLVTINATDPRVGWGMSRTVKNQTFDHLRAGLDWILSHYPLPIMGVDIDPDSELLTDDILAWCHQHNIPLITRSRVEESNYNAHIEQRNGDWVRKHAFRHRYETDTEMELLNRLWPLVMARKNHLLPCVKVTGWTQTRSGRIGRVYDRPATPYQRLLSDGLPGQARIAARLAAEHDNLNPAAITREINALQARLVESARARNTINPAGSPESTSPSST